MLPSVLSNLMDYLTEVKSEPPKKEEQPQQKNPKTSIQLSERILNFFYYQNHIVCRGQKHILIYNTLLRKMHTLPAPTTPYIVEPLPPFLLAVIEGQFMQLINEDLASEGVRVKISKLEPKAICRYNKGYFLGGYNRSILPGGRHTTRRSIYFLDKLDFEQKNTPSATIKLEQSQEPVSHLRVQNPYLLAYCKPTIYLISIFSREILLTFQKQATEILVLQGRFATSCLNGIGISSRRAGVFTFDVQRFPLYGVEISEHKQEADCLCLERTGRVFVGKGKFVYEYHPGWQQQKQWTRYEEGDKVIWMSCTPNNSLMVLKESKMGKSVIDVYGLE